MVFDMELPNIRDELDGFGRVARIAKKPDYEEYVRVLKLTGLGMVIMGAIGLIVTVVAVKVGL